MKTLYSVIILLAACSGNEEAGDQQDLPICINEFMADNDASLSVLGEYPDWIELYNPTDEAVALDGWTISDDQAQPNKHQFQDGLMVPAHEGIVLYADERPDLGNDHLPFTLNVDGEWITLTSPNGRSTTINYGPLTGDVTASRTSDCCDEPDCWTYLFAGSPGESNSTAEVKTETLMETGGDWLVYDNGQEPAGDWTSPEYDDSSWWSGTAPLGYGDAHIETEVSYGSNPNDKYITTYFRSTFESSDVGVLDEISVEILYDDGAAIYINGSEVARSNLSDGPLGYDTLAIAATATETTYQSFVLTQAVIGALLVDGTNTIAVEVHQADPGSSDQGMDVGVTGQWTVPPSADSSDLGSYSADIEEVSGLTDPSSFLFTRDKIHQIDLVIPPSSWTALDANPYEYQPASIALEGQNVATVGVRLRGKYGSFRTLAEKPKFKIDFNRFVDNQRFFGLKSLSLNNSVVDCSYLREVVSYSAIARAGLPTPRVAFTNVTVNGADYGLYQILDSQDDVWIERHWSESDGNLYDGKYAYEWPWIWIGFVDFWPDMESLFQLEEGVDVGLADIHNITQINTEYGLTESYYEEMGQYLDWEQWHRHMAAEMWTGHLDGYWANDNNYRVYFDPADGLADFVVWDLDYSLYEAWQWGMNWDNPAGIIAWYCRMDSKCWKEQREATRWLAHSMDTDSLQAEFEEALNLIKGRSVSDPRAECSVNGITNEQDYVRDWIINRSDDVVDMLEN